MNPDIQRFMEWHGYKSDGEKFKKRDIIEELFNRESVQSVFKDTDLWEAVKNEAEKSKVT